jgi:hypothetical protein
MIEETGDAASIRKFDLRNLASVLAQPSNQKDLSPHDQVFFSKEIHLTP